MDSDYYSQSQNTKDFTQNTLSLRGSKVRAGTIIRIQMKNFMCHDNLEVNLHPRINFVIGKNGSGKSAIQTAVAVGLGGKAISTNRGSSLKELIKNGKNTSTITIEMCNQGPLAYRPDEYGETITVERTFSDTSGSYKLKNSSGKIVSKEKKELDKIVAQFNLQTSNPLCILHQDVARNFLNSSDPKNKFKFFMGASRFDEISKLHNETYYKLHSVKGLIESKFEALTEAFKDVMEMKKKLKTLEDAKEKEKHRENLENELVWAKVNETNMEVNALQKKRDNEILAKKNAERKVMEAEENNLQEQLSELEARIEEMNNLVKDAKEKLGPAKEAFSRKKEQLADLKGEVNDAKRSVNLNKGKYENCLGEIEKLTKNAPDIKMQQERLKNEIAEYENMLAGIKAAENTFQHDRQQLRDTVDNVNSNLQAITNRLQEFHRQKRKKEEQIKQITKNASSLNVYGDLMVMIVEEINKAASQGKFQKKPVGPLGIHVKVRDPTWAGAVESFLGKGFLSSFCVDNSKDAVVLSNILKTLCTRHRATQPAIYNSKFLPKMHNIRSGETGTRNYSNLARALDIDNVVVANCLIDQLEAETVLLIPTNGEAYQLLDEEHKVPQNCKRALTLTGDQVYPAPNYRSYASAKPVTRATLLQTNQEDIISELNSDINKIMQEMSVVEQEQLNYKQQASTTLDSLKKNEAELNTLKRKRYALEQKLDQLRSSIEPEENTNVGYFIEESKVLEHQLHAAQEKYQALKSDFEALSVEAEKAKKTYVELQNTVAESDREKAPIQAEIQRLKSTIHQATTKVDLMKQKVREHEQRLSQIEQNLTELTAQLTENTENASQICEPINTQRTTAEIHKELKNVVMYLKRLQEESGGSLMDVQKTVSERMQVFEAVKKDLNALRSLAMKIHQCLKSRKSKAARFQQILINAAKNNFKMYLHTRNFDGKLDIDTAAETLHIWVKPLNISDPNLKQLDTASLSGGEKSFSTVCFMMALWQEIPLPSHFLDEFDVFMDGVNRRIVMDLLIEYAKQVDQQFVFLTPLDTSSITVDDLVMVHRLQAPRD